jgi:hypothetical protein
MSASQFDRVVGTHQCHARRAVATHCQPTTDHAVDHECQGTGDGPGQQVAAWHQVHVERDQCRLRADTDGHREHRLGQPRPGAQARLALVEAGEVADHDLQAVAAAA